MKIGLYFGTYNPIHVGHLIIANHIAEFADIDQIWMVVTPHNPLKKKATLLDDQQRLQMVYLATEDYPKIKPSDIEFKLTQPNYTVNTLSHLHDKYPNHEFSLIMGEDNLKTLHKWKNYEVILKDYHIYVYPRPNFANADLENHPSITITQTPLMELSSTFIRKAIKEKKNIQFFLPDKVIEFIEGKGMYR